MIWAAVVTMLAGVGCLVWGCWLIYPPLAWVVGGVLLLIVGDLLVDEDALRERYRPRPLEIQSLREAVGVLQCRPDAWAKDHAGRLDRWLARMGR